MSYDKENRLKTMNASGSLFTYTYDGDGLKKLEEDLFGSKILLWDGFDYLGEVHEGEFRQEYFTIDSQILARIDTRERYEMLSDYLGSVTAEYNSDMGRTFRAWYSPYGGGATSSGNPGRFGWIGSYGYRDAAYTNWNHPATQYLTSYVRARHYSRRMGRWTTVDPLYPSENAYGYVGGKVTIWTDPTGTKLVFKCNNSNNIENPCDKILGNDGLGNSIIRDRIKRCLGETGRSLPKDMLNNLLKGLETACKNNSKPICVFCKKDIKESDPAAAYCIDLCGKNTEGVTIGIAIPPIVPIPEPFEIPIPGDKKCKHYGTDLGVYAKKCFEVLPPVVKGECTGGGILLCKNGNSSMVLHELIHVIGLGGAEKEIHDQGIDLVYMLQKCICKTLNLNSICK